MSDKIILLILALIAGIGIFCALDMALGEEYTVVASVIDKVHEIDEDGASEYVFWLEWQGRAYSTKVSFDMWNKTRIRDRVNWTRRVGKFSEKLY
jgi:hypothetical protein